MTTYILGAGASHDAGYPLCCELWSRMAAWVIKTEPPESEYLEAIRTVNARATPIVDVEQGYGRSFEADWDEPGSDVTVLKLHGSINWIGSLFGGARGGHFGGFSSSLGPRPFVDNVDLAFPDYPKGVLDKSFPGGGVLDGAPTVVLPTYEKQFLVQTSVGKEWIPFYSSLWSQAGEFLEKSERVVIIGYSMPSADRQAGELILSKSNKCADVFVCCASSNESLAARFRDHGFLHVHQIGGFAEWLFDPRSTK